MRASAYCQIDHRAGRRGSALLIAMITLGLVSAMAVSMVQIVTLRHSQSDREQWRLQSAWLSESALVRALDRVSRDPDYTGESWQIDDIDARHLSGVVRIEILSNAEGHTLIVTADFPDDPVDRVRTTRTWTTADVVR